MTDAAITGVGLVTPAGIGAGVNWAKVCEGRSTAAVDPYLDGIPLHLSCRVPDFDGAALLGARRALHLDRVTQFALVAAGEAIADAGLTPSSWDGARVGVVLGTANGGIGTVEEQHLTLVRDGFKRLSPYLLPMQLPNMLAGQVAMEFGATGPNLVVSTACASGTTAIGVARDLLALGRCDIVLAGGSEAMITPLMVGGFARMGALSERTDEPQAASRPFDIDRDGFVIGEGSGVLVLERPEYARARGARVLSRVVGYGASADAHHATAPHPGGEGAEAALRAALADAGAGGADVDHVNAHGTSTRLNDRIEADVLRRVLVGHPPTTSTKGVTGHLLGAAGAIEAVYTTMAIDSGTVPPTANLTTQDPRIDLSLVSEPTRVKMGLALSSSFGFGGQNAVLALAAP
ncbi:beta-ketoacyl-[acyl-carrier-protein] synthase family protein [Streptomyces sp. MMBL 11-3]|uniref:beta-ketoacyl-[acyl-carrier-protein] synthase family protein n=1 Tax=Streptomyces sp. MMBL 11-3 TaxID=3382639 RepID=UPI0039B648CA